MKGINKLLYVFIFAPLLLITGCKDSFKTGDIMEHPIGVIPRPRIEKYGEKSLILDKKEKIITLYISNSSNQNAGPIDEGINLFSKRLKSLSNVELDILTESGDHQIIIDLCTKQELSGILSEEDIQDAVEGKRLDQAYYLEVTEASGNNPEVTIKACSNLGLYYGLVSLIQLIDSNDDGQIRLPEVKIVDWPEACLRLAKTSGTTNPLNLINKLADWMPVYKINMLGLQFHGQESKELGPFEENVESVCSGQKELGLLETIVYFCPFRGKGYDFTQSEDRDAYVNLINWFFDQGAHGLEVDYNDWPGEKVPIEDVINLAYNAVMARNPDAYILYCPPNTGNQQYRGAATEEMRNTLSKVPPKIWPLWTGMTTIVTDTLKSEHVEQWTEGAGRRPFFWMNRASIGVERSFSRPLEGSPESLVIPGELLSKELNRLFEGIHLNFVFSAGSRHTIPEKVSFKEFAYFATVADYLWNPYDWEDKESYKRANHFVSIMKPLVYK